MNVNKLIIDISNAEVVSDSEVMSEEEIYGKEYISVDGKAPFTDMKTADSVDHISMKGSNTRIRIINDTVYPDSIYLSLI
jgi:hypothetical protein